MIRKAIGALIFLAAVAARGGLPDAPRLEGVELEVVEPETDAPPVAIAPDGRLTATTAGNREGFTIEGWSCGSCRRRLPVPPGVGPITALGLAAGGKLAVSGHADGTVVVWDLELGGERSRLKLHQSPVRALALSPAGRLLASLAPPEPAVPLVDLEAGVRIGTLPSDRADHRSVAFSPDGRRIAVGSAGLAEVWKVATTEAVCTIPLAGAAAEAVAFSPDAELLAIGTGSAVRLARTGTGQILAELAGSVGTSGAVSFSGDGKRLAAPGPDGELWIFEIPSGRVSLRSHVFDARIAVTAFLAEPARVAWGGGEIRGLVRLE